MIWVLRGPTRAPKAQEYSLRKHREYYESEVCGGGVSLPIGVGSGHPESNFIIA